jgi:hypothetical protein
VNRWKCRRAHALRLLVTFSLRTGARIFSSCIGEPQPSIAKKLGYDGEVEQVDTAVYGNRVICECGNVRYVKKQDRFQVKKCKSCTARGRRQRRRKNGRRW